MLDMSADADFDLEQCSFLEPYPFAQTNAATYDATLVDWRSIVKSFEYLAAKEPRCVLDLSQGRKCL